ncbi:MAG: hypothetical protein ALAOOOJD_03921 [bacterium]|nr:hypothetical protein [bacterium]
MNRGCSCKKTVVIQRRGFRGVEIRPFFQIFLIRILLPLEWIRIAGFDVRVVLLPIDQLRTCLCIFFREQAFDRLFRRKIRIAVIKIAVGKREVHGLIQRVNVFGAVEAHAFQIKIFQNVQRLQHDRALHPAIELVHFDVFVHRHHRRFEIDFPLGEIFQRVQPTLFFGTADKFLRDVAFVKTIVRRVNCLFAIFARGQRLLFGFD